MVNAVNYTTGKCLFIELSKENSDAVTAALISKSIFLAM
jgi:hypothetical protein